MVRPVSSFWLNKYYLPVRESEKNCSNRAYKIHYLYKTRVVCVHIMFVLRHGRDVHPTWASVDNVTATLRVWDSKSTKSDKDLASF